MKTAVLPNSRLIERCDFGAPYEPFSLSAKITLFAESTLQNGESGGAVLLEGV